MGTTENPLWWVWVTGVSLLVAASVVAFAIIDRPNQRCESLQIGTVEGNRIFLVGCTDTRALVREMVKICAPVKPVVSPHDLAAGEAGAIAEVWCEPLP
jgi:hypothetical protein